MSAGRRGRWGARLCQQCVWQPEQCQNTVWRVGCQRRSKICLQLPSLPGGSNFFQLSGGTWNGVSGLSQGLMSYAPLANSGTPMFDSCHNLCFLSTLISVFTETWQQGTFCCLTIKWWRSVTSVWPDTSSMTPTMFAREMWVDFLYFYFLFFLCNMRHELSFLQYVSTFQAFKQ